MTIQTPISTAQADLDLTVTHLAREQCYSAAAISAGLEFSSRKARRSNPPGKFDRAGRFTAAERSRAVERAYGPSRAYPYGEMTAARTAAHCAEISGCSEELTEVRRIAVARDRLEAGASIEEITELLKKGIRARKAKL